MNVDLTVAIYLKQMFEIIIRAEVGGVFGGGGGDVIGGDVIVAHSR